jgi:prepilin-type N-terminal cleavage/methylation domain-containing protein
MHHSGCVTQKERDELNVQNTTPVSNNVAYRGFTLTELLISLSVLGLVSAITLPKVFASVDETQKKAVFKETLNSLQQLFATEAAFGGTSQPSLALVQKGLNAKECSARLSVTRPSGRNTRYGCVLQNGAYILDLNGTGTGETITIDWNGNAAPNTFGQDRMVVLASWSTQNVNTVAGNNASSQTGRVEIRPGEVLPNLASRSLYNSLFSR